MNLSEKDKIYVAGSNGMVGSAICRLLNKKGYKNEKNNLLTPSRYDLDLTNLNDVQKWFNIQNPQIVIIAAAKVGGIMANMSNPVDFLLENLKIQNNLIETSWKFGVKRLVFLGSSCIYPKFAEQPIKEESLLTGELEPTNQWYAIAKISGIKLCDALRKQYGFDAISLMPTNLYGPGDNYHLQNSHVFASFIRKFYDASKANLSYVTCWGTGKPLREFMHVDDLGNAVLFALENWSPNSENAPLDSKGIPLTLLNVGTGIDISIKDLAKEISQTIGYKGKTEWDNTKPDGTFKKQLDVSKLMSLGWEPKIKLKEGIKNTINNYKKEVAEKSFREA